MLVFCPSLNRGRNDVTYWGPTQYAVLKHKIYILRNMKTLIKGIEIYQNKKPHQFVTSFWLHKLSRLKTKSDIEKQTLFFFSSLFYQHSGHISSNLGSCYFVQHFKHVLKIKALCWERCLNKWWPKQNI